MRQRNMTTDIGKIKICETARGLEQAS